MNAALAALFSDLLSRQRSTPPVDRWDPPCCGDMDLTICRNGDWVHEGRKIERQELVELFASILKREGEQYYLVTPVEKWRIVVEDAPLHVVSVERERRQQQTALVFRTATGDTVVAGPDNPIAVTTCANTGEPRPYLLVRRNLSGLLSRPVFYQLADWSEQRHADGRACYGVASLGRFFPLEGE